MELGSSLDPQLKKKPGLKWDLIVEPDLKKRITINK
jgi:hypothetical protein